MSSPVAAPSVSDERFQSGSHLPATAASSIADRPASRDSNQCIIGQLDSAATATVSEIAGLDRIIADTDVALLESKIESHDTDKANAATDPSVSCFPAAPVDNEPGIQEKSSQFFFFLVSDTIRRGVHQLPL